MADAALAAAIDAMVDGGRLGDIGAAVQGVVDGAGFAVVRDYTGHGIGRAMHEDPAVHNTGRTGTGPRLRSGNVLAIEPMVSAGTDETVVLDDGWSVLTADGALGRPHRAHRRRHRRRPRGPHRVPLSSGARSSLLAPASPIRFSGSAAPPGGLRSLSETCVTCG